MRSIKVTVIKHFLSRIVLISLIVISSTLNAVSHNQGSSTNTSNVNKSDRYKLDQNCNYFANTLLNASCADPDRNMYFGIRALGTTKELPYYNFIVTPQINQQRYEYQNKVNNMLYMSMP